MPPGNFLDIGGLQGGVKFVEIPSYIILSNFCFWKQAQKRLPRPGAVPPGEVLVEGDLQGGVKFVEKPSNIIWNKFCLLK